MKDTPGPDGPLAEARCVLHRLPMTPHGQDDPAGKPVDQLRLVQAIVGADQRRAPRILTDRLPEGWPADIVPPSPARSLGGVDSGTASTAVFEYPEAVTGAFAEYRALVERAGFSAPEDGMRSPLESAHTALYDRAGDMLFMRRVETDGQGTTIVASFTPGAGAQRAARMQGFPPSDHGIRIPRMRAPETVQYDSGGGSSSGGDHKSVHIRIVTALAPADLLPYYVGELERAGWKAGAAHATPESATRWFEATDDDGRTWRGPLIVYVIDDSREVFLYMATATEDPRRGGPARRRPHPSSL
jgi:hypothetical protein